MISASPICLCMSAALALCLTCGTIPAAAQDGDIPAVVEPIEDLQGNFHFTPQDLVDVLSSHSLMLSRAESERIEEAKRVARERESIHEEFAGLTQDAVISTTLQQDYFQLDAIMYLSRQSWTFWLNGEAVTPELLPQGISVLSVAPNLVELSWVRDPNRPDSVRRFVLEPGQAYVVADGAVVESDEVAGHTQEQSTGGNETTGGDDDSDGAGTGTAGDAEPTDLALSPEQVQQLSELQQALSIVSGNASALGMTEDELQQLQQSLAASGDTSSLSAEQQEQLQRIQQATGIE